MATSAVNGSSGGGGNTIQSSKKALKTEDFIQMMVTQLQNQDPLEPAKNQELLAQMSQIGQLQSQESLQKSLADQTATMQQMFGKFGVQSQLSFAGSLIGKNVSGSDAEGKDVEGVVTSVRFEKDVVRLELDNGKTMPLDGVEAIEGVKAGSSN